MSYAPLIFSMLFFLAFGVYLFLGIYLLQLNPKASLNRSFLVVCIAMCFWSLGFSMANSAPDLETALFWRRFSAIGWSTIYSVLLHFFLLLTTEKHSRKSWFFWFLLHLPALVCLYVFSLSKTIAPAQYNLVAKDFGWVNAGVNNGWDWFFYGYCVGYTVAVLRVVWLWNRRATDINVRVQSKLIFRSLLVLALLGSLFDLVLSSIMANPFPQLGPLVVLIPMGVTYYVVKRYRFMHQQGKKAEHLILDAATRTRLFHYTALGFLAVGLLMFGPVLLPAAQDGGAIAQYRMQASVVIFGLGLVILLLKWLKQERLRDLIILLLTLFSIPAITLRFFEYSGITIWAFPMLLMIVSLVFDTRVPLVLITITAIGTEVILWKFAPQVPIQRDGFDYMVRIGLFLIAFRLGTVVNKLYVERLRDNVQKVELQKLISDTSFDFMNIKQSNLDDKIGGLLERAGHFFQVDRAVLFRLHDDDRSMTVTHEWCKEGFASKLGTTWSLPPDFYPLFMDQLKSNKLFSAQEMDDLPLTAASAGSQGRAEVLKSVVSIPIEESGEVLALLGLECLVRAKECSSTQIEALKVLANLLSDGVIRARAEREIEFLAYYDELTGLPNRALFADRLNQALHLAKRNATFVGVIFIDLDGFKMVNDTMGHRHGDRILQEVARSMERRLRRMDTVARFGGDEFLVMVSDIRNNSDIGGIADKVMGVFREPFVLGEQEFFVTASAGIAVYPVDGEDAESLMKNADIAMSRAKSNGKNQYALCTSHMKEEIRRSMMLSNHLFRAEGRGELTLHYQPQVRLDTGEIIGLEALLRWKHPELGMIPPNVFIPIAEKNGLINSMGEWVLHTAGQQNKAWQAKGFPPVPVSVNLSVVQLNDPRIVDRVKSVFRETGLKPQYLELEITENIAIKDISHTISTFNRLKDLGVSIAIDDFGTEYSSLSRLKNLPVDRIKIDMHFVQSIESSEKDRAITEVIINLAKSLGMEVLAEGVETAFQVEFLNQKQCHAAQGYYYYRPMPAAAIEGILRSQGPELGLMGGCSHEQV